MIVQTQNTSNNYAALNWITNGGSALTTNADPNTVGGGGAGSVAALQALGRIITTPPGPFVTSAYALVAFSYDGTSAIVRFWWYDDVQLIWVPNGNVGTLTTASTNSLAQAVGCMPGAKFYCQITSNTGVTKIAFTLR